MIGKTILHYKILEKLGEGGMGVVYLAEDTKLDRQVAIKFLPPHISDNSDERKRFAIEAKAAASLNHPNISHIYAIEEVDDEMFIVMEYLEGKELKAIIKEHGTIAQAQAINYAIQITEGLQAAHEKGIVHRDIKSSNIMITNDGQVKIMDFGLAKVSGSSQLTKDQSTVGTVAYMSPEQARGDAVDQRTDIWAFGVVLYEMLTGFLPFKGDYEQAVIYSILNEQPEPISTDNSQTGHNLEMIVNRNLEKDVLQRYQTMDQVLADLKIVNKPSIKNESMANSETDKSAKIRKAVIWISTAAAFFILAISIFIINQSPPENTIDSIAVLPFENFSGDQNQEYFVDGMTEALISNLAQINSLRVISRTSVMKYKGTREPLKEIARELDVDVILEGSVFQEANRARISVQLIDAATEKHIWAEKYERELKDILALHNELSLSVTREVKIALTEEEETRLSRIEQVNSDAHDAYLKGQYHVTQYTQGIGDVNHLEDGISYLQQAISFEPNWSKAHASLAYAYHWLASSEKLNEYFPLSKASALRAIKLDESLAQAYRSLAFVLHNYEWDWDGAANAYQRANELNPNSYGWGIALFYKSAGFYKQAIRWYQRAIERNPLSAPLQRQLGETYLLNGQAEQALEQASKSLELNPNSASARTLKANVYLEKKMFRQAIEQAETASIINNRPLYAARLGYVYAKSGRIKDAQRTLQQLKDGFSDYYILPLAELYAVLGHNEKALSLVEKSYNNKNTDLLYIKETVLIDSLRQYSKFREIIESINFPTTPYTF